MTLSYVTQALARAALPIRVSYVVPIMPPSTSDGRPGGYWLIEGAGTGIACPSREMAHAWYRTLVAWYRQDIEDRKEQS